MAHYLAIQPGKATEEIPGEPTRDPAFGLPAVWITEEDRERAERLGYTVVDPPSIIATHLTEIIKRYAGIIRQTVWAACAQYAALWNDSEVCMRAGVPLF